MEILVVGGSRFVGRHVVEHAVARGHRVWLANRGRTTTDVFGAAGLLRIDRDTGALAELAGRSFDAVVDVSAYVPRHVAQLHDALGRVGHHVLVSTVSAYDPAALARHHDEATPLQPARDDTEQVTSSSYGPLKVACEQVARERVDAAGLAVVRPGIVAGPHDHTDRFTWWPRHLAADEVVRLPDRRGQDLAGDVQVIDARDLGAFLVHLAEQRTNGTFDAVGVARPLAEFVAGVAAAVGGTGEVEWIAPGEDDHGDADDAWLPPLVLPPGSDQVGIFSRSPDRAVEAGLDLRSLSATTVDTLAWDRERGLPPLATEPA